MDDLQEPLGLCQAHRDRIWQWQEVEAQSLPRANGSRFAGQIGGALEGRALAQRTDGTHAGQHSSAPLTKAVLSQQKQGRPRMHLSTTHSSEEAGPLPPSARRDSPAAVVRSPRTESGFAVTPRGHHRFVEFGIASHFEGEELLTPRRTSDMLAQRVKVFRELKTPSGEGTSGPVSKELTPPIGETVGSAGRMAPPLPPRIRDILGDLSPSVPPRLPAQAPAQQSPRRKPGAAVDLSRTRPGSSAQGSSPCHVLDTDVPTDVPLGSPTNDAEIARVHQEPPPQSTAAQLLPFAKRNARTQALQADLDAPAKGPSNDERGAEQAEEDLASETQTDTHEETHERQTLQSSGKSRHDGQRSSRADAAEPLVASACPQGVAILSPRRSTRGVASASIGFLSPSSSSHANASCDQSSEAGMEGNYVLIEGFLHKQCKHACLLFGALWVKRFFVLYPGRLQYYRSEADRTQGLPQSREVEVDENVVAVSRKQSTMEVFLNATSMPMRLRASDPVQAGRWAAALMGRANTRTGASLRTASVTAETGRTRSNGNFEATPTVASGPVSLWTPPTIAVELTTHAVKHPM